MVSNIRQSDINMLHYNNVSSQIWTKLGNKNANI